MTDGNQMNNSWQIIYFDEFFPLFLFANCLQVAYEHLKRTRDLKLTAGYFPQITPSL